MGERVVRRRLFLGSLGAAGATMTVAACQDRTPTPTTTGHDHAPPVSLPDPVVRTQPPTTLRFLTEPQARTVEAMCARIIPGREDDPGAVEAGAVFYIDQLLAGHSGYPEPAYLQGPFAQTYSGDSPPAEEDGVVWIGEEELERYGRQSAFTPQQTYPMGLARLDQLCEDRHGEIFAELPAEEQDAVPDLFDEVSASTFFEMVRTHTVQGFLSDPLYGGNRDMVGWRHIGFPGSRRSFSRADIYDENFDVTPQSLLDLAPFNADRPSHHHDVPIAVRTRHPNGPRD